MLMVFIAAVLASIIQRPVTQAAGHTGERLYPVYNLDNVSIDVEDGSVEDWIDAGIPPSVTGLDFLPHGFESDGEHIYDPADLDLRLFLGWRSDPIRVFCALDRVDDEYVNNYDPSSDATGQERVIGAWDGGIALGIDGDHSGGIYRDWDLSEQDRRGLWFQQAQRYMALAEVFSGETHVTQQSAWGSEALFYLRPPYADAGGGVYKGTPVRTITELYITPFDHLVWHSSEESIVSFLHGGMIIGFDIVVTEIESRSSTGHFISWYALNELEGSDNADYFLDGVLLDSDGRVEDTSVENQTWSRIKASLMK